MNRKIAIIGAGPIGIEAAVYARALGHDVAVYERGDVAGNVAAWGFVGLFSPWAMDATPLGWQVLSESGHVDRPHPQVCPTGAELRDRYLLPLARSPLLHGVIHPHTAVVAVGREDMHKADAIGQPDRARSPFRLLVRDGAGRERIEAADVVLDCSGTYGNHRWAGRGGIPAPGERALAAAGRIRYTIPDVLGRDRDRFTDRHTLVLGCGYSATTVLHGLERLARDHPRTRVTWAIRRLGQALQAVHNDPLEARANLVRASLKLADHPPGWLQYLGSCVLERVDPAGPGATAGDDGTIGVTLRHGQTDLAMHVHEVVALVGYVPDASVYEQLQVHQCYATAGPMKLAAALLGEAGADCLAAGAAVGPDTLRNPEPDFYILGAKSYGTNSNFLLQVGHRQVRDAFRIIAGDPSLDLHARYAGR
jgi:hypothetical protein